MPVGTKLNSGPASTIWFEVVHYALIGILSIHPEILNYACKRLNQTGLLKTGERTGSKNNHNDNEEERCSYYQPIS